MSLLYNDTSVKTKRRSLRQKQTDAERKVWGILRRKQIHGFKFFRQYSVGSYILDFYCPDQHLAVELDGGHHGEDGQKVYDKKRTEYLRRHNIRVLRFWNNDVLANPEGMTEQIKENVHNPS